MFLRDKLMPIFVSPKYMGDGENIHANHILSIIIGSMRSHSLVYAAIRMVFQRLSLPIADKTSTSTFIYNSPIFQTIKDGIKRI